jgi:hypothetical protein
VAEDEFERLRREAATGDTKAALTLAGIETRAGHHESARRLITPGAQAGDLEAMLQLGLTFNNLEQSDEAERWMLASASRGKLRAAAKKHGAEVLVIAPVGGVITNHGVTETVQRTLLTARSVEFDGVVIAAGVLPSNDIKLVLLLQEAFRHCKPLGACGTAVPCLKVRASL